MREVKRFAQIDTGNRPNEGQKAMGWYGVWVTGSYMASGPAVLVYGQVVAEPATGEFEVKAAPIRTSNESLHEFDGVGRWIVTDDQLIAKWTLAPTLNDLMAALHATKATPGTEVRT